MVGEQERAARQVERAIKQHKLELVRFSFADQHGVLRGKTLLASEVPGALRGGVTMTTTLLAKDTAHRTVYPVFTPGGGFAMEEMQGGGDFVMIADPTTFRVLPWPRKPAGSCATCISNGKPVPFSTRARCRDALDTLAKPASISAPGWKWNSICSSSRTRAFNPKTPLGRRRRRN